MDYKERFPVFRSWLLGDVGLERAHGVIHFCERNALFFSFATQWKTGRSRRLVRQKSFDRITTSVVHTCIGLKVLSKSVNATSRYMFPIRIIIISFIIVFLVYLPVYVFFRYVIITISTSILNVVLGLYYLAYVRYNKPNESYIIRSQVIYIYYTRVYI